MVITSKMLIGAWRLESWSLIYSDGRAPEFPLGPDAKGMIMYTAGGQVSATLMRAQRPHKHRSRLECSWFPRASS